MVWTNTFGGMKNYNYAILFILFTSVCFSQTNIFENFETASPTYNWTGDDCEIMAYFNNPEVSAENTSSHVLNYKDTGGEFANVRFDYGEKFDLSATHEFSLRIYVPSESITGTQPNQLSLKLQNVDLGTPWSTQTEIIKPLVLDQWQSVSFNFNEDNYINHDPNSPAPNLRSDLNRVLLQVNGEANTSTVTAYIDDFGYTSEATSPPPVDEPNFDNLVWSDEFNDSGALDSEKWFHQTQLPEGESWYNGEIQHYTDRIDNAEVSNGTLKIRAKKETFTDQNVTKDYTSARLNSKYAFTYGKVDIRAKLPTGEGTWPALWMLGKNIDEDGAYWDNQSYDTTSWPACGEIDIMEHWGYNQNYISSALHTPSSFGGTVNVGGRHIDNVSTEFKVYTMIWTEDYIEFQVDGTTHYTYNPTVKNNDTWPFDKDHYFLFNVAIQPSITTTNFTESSLEVDYIRVYQESTMSQEEVSKLEQIKLYPNPAKTEVYLKNSELISKYSIYNHLGQLIQHKKLLEPKINVKDLPVGLYFLEVIDEHQNKLIKKLIIQ
jgi:beta-glucanase (GH16 family)